MATERNTASQPAWRSALALAAVALIGTTLLAGVWELSRERIAEQEQRVVLRQLGQVVAAGSYDNDLHLDYYDFRDARFFPGQDRVRVYRARLGERPVAVVFEMAAMDGYNGRIGLLVGMTADGRLSGVRAGSHNETPGLGDAIEIERSDWILSFDGRSLTNTRPEEWNVRRDGGDFDQFTGATITPRAVVRAVARALEYYELNHKTLFSHPADRPAESGT